MQRKLFRFTGFHGLEWSQCWKTIQEACGSWVKQVFCKQSLALLQALQEESEKSPLKEYEISKVVDRKENVCDRMDPPDSY